jgi:predicted nucleotidyltransferase
VREVPQPTDLTGAGRAISQVLPLVPVDMDLYLFGSVARGDATQASDVDLLLVYPSGKHDLAHEISRAMRELSPEGRLEVISMSHAEAEETDFIAGERAILLTKRGV